MATEIRDYIDLKKNYYILAPLTEDAHEKMLNYDFCSDGKVLGDIAYMVFHEDTYNYMESRLFDFINVELGILINMYEEEYIEYKDLEKAAEITRRLISNSDDAKFVSFAKQFQGLLSLALDHHTELGLYF